MKIRRESARSTPDPDLPDGLWLKIGRSRYKAVRRFNGIRAGTVINTGPPGRRRT